MSASVRYCGREFPASELALIRALIAQRQPRLSRSALSRAVCAALQWRKPDGRLKEMSARVALLRMQPDGLLTLHPGAARPPSRTWNECVQRYHYLGYTPLPGAQLRYFVQAADGLLLALLGCGAAAWKTAPRDRFVGWDRATRKRNLTRVVNHARYLILPKVAA